MGWEAAVGAPGGTLSELFGVGMYDPVAQRKGAADFIVERHGISPFG